MIAGVSMAAWLILYFRRLLKRLPQPGGVRRGSRAESHDEPQENRPSLERSQQLEGGGVIRGKPDDHIHELHVQPAEKPDDQIHELPSGPAESTSGDTFVAENAPHQETTEAHPRRGSC